MKYMRLVALGASVVHVQTSDNKIDWTQTIMEIDEFDTFMRENFPKEYTEYENHLVTLEWWERDDSPYFFYHYGETPEMIRSGDAYIFEK